MHHFRREKIRISSLGMGSHDMDNDNSRLGVLVEAPCRTEKEEFRVVAWWHVEAQPMMSLSQIVPEPYGLASIYRSMRLIWTGS